MKSRFSKITSLAFSSFAILFALVAVSGSLIAFAQDGAAEAEKKERSAMGVRHQRVEQMMLELDRKFNTLSERLQKTEPERAKRLVEALQKAKELLIQKRLGEITSLLNDARYDTAIDEQQEILSDLKELIKLLLNEQVDEDKLKKEEQEALTKIKKDIERILKDEQREEAESRKLANKDDTLKDLDAQIAAVKNLIKKQNDVNTETDENKERGPQALDGVANKQHNVRKETESVAEKIAKQGMPDPKDAEPEDGEPKDGEPKDGEPKDGKPADGKPSDGKPKEGEPKDGKPSEGQPKDGKPSDGKPSDGKPSDGKPSDGKPSDGEPKDGEPKDGEPKEGAQGEQQPKDDPNRPPQPGEKPLKSAAKNQKEAEENLARGKPEQAQKDEKKAADDLKAALDELEKEKRRIATLPPEAFDKLADNQKKIEKKVGDVQKAMDEAEKKKAESEGKDGKSGDSPKTPGKEQMKKAQQAMKNASQNLEKQDPQAANRQQKEAIKEMKEALREIEDRLKQLRDETQEEKLARLEARFNEMLAKQQLASALTKQLDDKRGGGNSRLRRGDLLQIAKLTASEREISELAQEAHDILVEDGTSVVFPEIVLDLKEDLLGVSDLLEETRTDELTQSIQYEIEVTLQELLEALKKEQRQRAGGGGGGGGGGGNPPLLPKSAELKMLRSSQLRVNRRTKKFDEIRGAGPLDEGMHREVENIADRQLKIIDLTERVLQNTGP